MLLNQTNEDTLATKPLPADIAVRVEGVSKRFKDFWALRNVSFDVRKGECVGIVGFNGAGKSTLLQIIADTLRATEGRTATSGQVVAMLQLGSGFNPEYTGIENLYMNAALLGIPSKVIDAKLDEIETFAEIGEHIHKPVKTYSSGMVIRLAFSLYTQINPEIMIIDEALSVGDTYFAHKCARLIRKYRAEGKTFLFVSHSETLVKSLCDRAILLDKGALIRDGKPAEVLDYYSAMVAHREREHEIRQIEKEEGRVITRSGNGKVRIARFELMNPEREPRRKFDRGAPALISCVIEAAIEVPAPTIGFMIRDRFGNDVFGTNTYHLDYKTKDLAPGEKLEAIFETQLNLGHGTYSLTLAVHDGPVHLENNYDWFDKLIVFQVFPDPQQFFSGVAALPSKVSVSKDISDLVRHYELGSLVDFTDTGNAHRFKVDGWHTPEHKLCWSNGHHAALSFDLLEVPAALSLAMDVQPFVCDSIHAQTVTVRVNEHPIATLAIDHNQRITLQIPQKLIRPRIDIQFELPDASSPARENAGHDERTLALALSSLRLIPANA